MKAAFGNANLTWGLIVAIVAGQVAWTSRGLAADSKPAAAGAAASSDTPSQDSVKIEPYKGPPIYLEEQEQVAAPTLVTRENVPEKYDDGKIRVERDVAHYSDNNIAADGKYREYHPNGKP